MGREAVQGRPRVEVLVTPPATPDARSSVAHDDTKGEVGPGVLGAVGPMVPLGPEAPTSGEDVASVVSPGVLAYEGRPRTGRNPRRSITTRDP